MVMRTFRRTKFTIMANSYVHQGEKLRRYKVDFIAHGVQNYKYIMAENEQHARVLAMAEGLVPLSCVPA